MFSGTDAPWHWVIIAVLVIALFGYKKLPDAARAMGRSMRIFKTEIKELTHDDAARETDQAAAPKPRPAPGIRRVLGQPASAPVPGPVSAPVSVPSPAAVEADRGSVAAPISSEPVRLPR